MDEEDVRSGFAPDTYRRLTALKAQYDPHNVLQTNHPIKG
jgi:FAD/FMN-containing dehydrogenase